MPRRSKSAIHSLYASRKSRPTSTADGPGYLYAFSDTGHKWKVVASETSAWESTTSLSPTVESVIPTVVNGNITDEKPADAIPETKGKDKEGSPSRKFRGVPDNVQLFEVFWKQVVELIKARPDLSIQDITALFHTLLRKYKNSKIDLHAQQTSANLTALLVAPINSYQSVLTLLAILNYALFLSRQLFSTRRSIAHSIVSSVLKNETIVEDRRTWMSDSASNPANGTSVRRQGAPHFIEREEKVGSQTANGRFGKPLQARESARRKEYKRLRQRRCLKLRKWDADTLNV
ncbi:hypothetical protein F5880DRAFT_1616376 [Lentinula raphanica]|nr:hypothetical protein F5880DRAFT_1616376 [Lentinula raphanica]